MTQLGEFIGNHWPLVLALVVILGLIIATEARRLVSSRYDVNPQRATALLNHERAVALDVRERNEFDEGHIVNARHVPLGELEQRVQELKKHKKKPVIAYCRTGQRSAKACKMLEQHGFESVYNLHGGLLAWQNSQLPVTRGDS